MKLNIRFVFSFLQPIKKLVPRKLVRTHSCRIEIGREPDFVMVIIFLSNLISIKLIKIRLKFKYISNRNLINPLVLMICHEIVLEKYARTVTVMSLVKIFPSKNLSVEPLERLSRRGAVRKRLR